MYYTNNMICKSGLIFRFPKGLVITQMIHTENTYILFIVPLGVVCTVFGFFTRYWPL